MQILLIEDETEVAAPLVQALRKEGHQVVVARGRNTGLEKVRKVRYDVIVVDGTTVTSMLRDAGIQTPVLSLATRSAPADIVQYLDAGADDCVTEPFSIAVLSARIRSVSRRGALLRPLVLEFNGVVADTATRRVTRAGKLISLTQREYSLLEVLLLNAGRVVSRESILKSVWGLNSEVTPNSLDAFIRLLRVKIDSGNPKLIHTVRGIGYIMKESS